ncbi:MAG TPA: threonine/serine dehydratase [Streptosporangiaceae bacterium]|nr:threonine/serine dehydratase [Streptosporangiaceae bacterium]
MSDAELTLDRVRAAAGRLAGVAHRTPLLTSGTLDRQCGTKVMLKAEPFQRSGSFKFRGAYNRLSLLSPAARQAGVVAFSSGNHGAAVALAAKLLDVEAVIVVPATGSAAKLAAIAGYGAELRRYDPDLESREEVAAKIAADRGMTLVRPFDDHDIMAGQGTAGLELAEQAPDLKRVLIPIGGGGLAAGVATAVKGLIPAASVIGVEPVRADDTRQSLAAGRRVSIPEPDTIADGLRASEPGELTFAVNSRLLDDVVTVTEDAIIETMRFCFTRLKIVVEPSGAVALAALLSSAVGAGGLTGVVLSGGNISPEDFGALLGA